MGNDNFSKVRSFEDLEVAETRNGVQNVNTSDEVTLEDSNETINPNQE